MGHGMGVPSMGIYSYELYQFFGVDTIIRIGSAGGIGDDVKVRDVVIALGASTNYHFADQYRFPGQLCATADFRLLRDAVETAEAMGVRADVGQVFTADQFYNCLLYTSGPGGPPSVLRHLGGPELPRGPGPQAVPLLSLIHI